MATKKNEQIEQLQQPLDENELDQVTGGFPPQTTERDTGDDDGYDVTTGFNGHRDNEQRPTRTPYFG